MDLVAIGVARSPHHDPSATPPQPDPQGPPVRLEVAAAYRDGLLGLEVGQQVQVLMWFDRADRDRLRQVSRTRPEAGERGVFSLRTPHRPNPIGVSVVEVVAIDDSGLIVRGLDCLDGTPILDVKPA